MDEVLEKIGAVSTAFPKLKDGPKDMCKLARLALTNSDCIFLACGISNH